MRSRREGLVAFTALALVAASGCAHGASTLAPTRTVAEEEHARTVRRYFDEVWSQGRLEVLDEILASNYVNHTPSTPNPPPGPGGLKPIVAAFREAFPDLRFTIQDMVVEGERVAIRVRMEGTHDGALFGIPATHRRVRVDQINIELFRGGRIVEHWRVTDEQGLMRQLGVAR
jgi:steroid delta-isomerase-like uncharacterized protein